MAILRIVFGFIVGVALGLGCVIAGDWINVQLFPPPSMDEWVAYAQSAPAYMLIALPIAYTLGAFVAAFVGAKIAARRWAGWVAGGVIVAGTIGNLMMIAHPLWLGIAFVICVPAGAWLGARLGFQPKVP